MDIGFHGAAREITGSCHLVETRSTRILVDCGLFQGGEDSYHRNLEPFPFDPRSIDAVILTHAHIDHIGRLPKLVKDGFTGRVFATHPTRLLSRLMWEDAVKVMEDDRRGSRKAPLLYSRKDFSRAFDLTHGFGYGTEIRVSDDFSFTFKDAGHIFGSAFLEAEVEGVRIAFSGDLGNDQVPILRDSENLGRVEVVVLESTYGNRRHESPGERMRRLGEAVRQTAGRRGTLLIPAFSLERTQEILYELNSLVEGGEVPEIPVFLDSPLAIRVLPVYHQFPELYDREAKALKEAGDDFFRFPGLRITKDPKESYGIMSVPPPKVIIAGSGMMHGGRIMRHLARHLSDPGTTVLVVGYQAEGTTGRAVTDGAEAVRIDHEDIPVRAQVESIGAYSAHADQDKLVRWAGGGSGWPERIFLVHGEEPAMESLAGRLRDECGVRVDIPALGDRFAIP
ncbi:hypothetical protein AMJ57_05620 [Parcubacteria bacterium SG8_24]|nr:MAG: hypothetical protein AMJ57_05620 [Parcubacteria bacterium SG8_24]